MTNEPCNSISVTSDFLSLDLQTETLQISSIKKCYQHIVKNKNKTKQIDYVLAAEDGEALYSQQKQDQELTVAKIMNSLLKNSDLN